MSIKSKDILSTADDISELGPDVGVGPVGCSNNNGSSNCCPGPSPCPGGGGAYITQVYESREGDNGVKICRKGSAVVIAHKTYETVIDKDDYAAKVVTDIVVRNGHVVEIDKSPIKDMVRPVVEDVLDDVLPDKLQEQVPEIVEEHLPELLVKDDTLKNVLVEADVLKESLNELNIVVDGGKAPSPESLRRRVY